MDQEKAGWMDPTFPATTRFGLPDPGTYVPGSLNQDLLYKSPFKREKEN